MVDPSGKFAYAANYSSSTISVYTIDQTTGALTLVGTPVTAGHGPYSVTVDPSGRFAYAANYHSGNISVYTIDQTTGALTTVGTPVAAGTGPISVKTSGAIQ
jgi:6-phosphogluconolactonase (cycloisomerase 2 family)